MRPNFALSLSLTGITLLRRVADNWEIVGETHLDEPDLADILKELRAKALQSPEEELKCALIIPDDQIRYLKTPSVDTDSDLGNALMVLENATPYTLDQLAYDTTLFEGNVHIAAVAKGTLEEAEKFAIEHGFDPVCFVSNPESQRYPGTPFFGPSSNVDPELNVEWDNKAITLVDRTASDATDVKTAGSEDGDQQDDLSAPVAFVSRRRQIETTSLDVGNEAAQQKPDEASLPTTGSAGQPVIPPPVKGTTDPEDDISIIAPTDFGNSPTAEPQQKELVADSQLDNASTKEKESRITPTIEGETESVKMTIFGAREQVGSGDKSRRFVYPLVAIFALAVIGVSTWAMFSTEDGSGGLFGNTEPDAELALTPETAAPDVQSNSPVSPDTSLSEQQIDRVNAPQSDDVTAEVRTPVSPDEQQPPTTAGDTSGDDAAIQHNNDSYATTGVWQLAPSEPTPPGTDDLNTLYEVSIDRTDLEQDAVALLSLPMLDTDQPMDAINAPAAAGTAFDMDENGLVIPTPEGALTPEGITVFSGQPPVSPPVPPTRFEAEPEDDTARDRLATLRPKPRPTDLVQQAERAQLGGLTRDELGNARPRIRPITEKQEAEIDETPTAQAIAISRTPKTRPGNFASQVAKTREREAGPSSQVSAAVVAPKTVAPKTVSPSIPSSASVARRATLDNAINLRRVNLIGVFGTPSNRRALVRLPNGRYKKIKIGDRIDGGRVIAIGENELRYQKGGRNVTLKMPRG